MNTNIWATKRNGIGCVGTCARSRVRSRLQSLRIEPLEERKLLSVDLAFNDLDEFYVEPGQFDLTVRYEVKYTDCPDEFDIGIYRCLDPETATPDLLLTTHHAEAGDLAQGPHTIAIPAQFEDAPLDYYLMAKLDCYEEIEETDEGNNSQLFEGGIFLGANRTTKVVGRHVFYNESWFDGNDPGANEADDNAIATDKFALLPGQKATFRNVTSYDKGINGVMIDVFNPDWPDGFQTETPDLEDKLWGQSSIPLK